MKFKLSDIARALNPVTLPGVVASKLPHGSSRTQAPASLPPGAGPTANTGPHTTNTYTEMGPAKPFVPPPPSIPGAAPAPSAAQSGAGMSFLDMLQALLPQVPAPDRAAYLAPYEQAAADAQAQYEGAQQALNGMPEGIMAAYAGLRNDSSARMAQLQQAQAQALAAAQAESQRQQQEIAAQTAALGGNAGAPAGSAGFLGQVAAQQQAAAQQYRGNMAQRATAGVETAQANALAGVDRGRSSLETNRAALLGKIAAGKAGADQQYQRDYTSFQNGQAQNIAKVGDSLSSLFDKVQQSQSNPGMDELSTRTDDAAVAAKHAMDAAGGDPNKAIITMKAARADVVDNHDKAVLDEAISLMERARKQPAELKTSSKDRDLLAVLQAAGLV